MWAQCPIASMLGKMEETAVGSVGNVDLKLRGCLDDWIEIDILILSFSNRN